MNVKPGFGLLKNGRCMIAFMPPVSNAIGSGTSVPHEKIE
jgi:hypothetical protein